MTPQRPKPGDHMGRGRYGAHWGRGQEAARAGMPELALAVGQVQGMGRASVLKGGWGLAH